MKSILPPSALLAAVLFVSPAVAQNATTTPVGAVTVTAAAGTGTAKKTSLISLPLLQSAQLVGKTSGKLSSLTSNSISDASAGWSAGELSTASAPKLLLITSGAAEGSMFLLSTTVQNTSTTATLATSEQNVVNLTTLGISVGENGDSYKILDCDTLSSLLGSPESTGVQGGTTSAAADTVLLVVNGVPSTYFYKTDSVPPRWTRVALGSPDASNTPITPYYGIQYSRLPASSVSFSVTGDVPVESRKVYVKNSGTTFISQYFPVDSTLASLGLNTLTSWLSGPNATSADNVILTTNGNPSTYWYDGTNWRRAALGNPISNTVSIPMGSTLYIVKRGSGAGYSLLSQNLPYSLQ